MNKLQHRVLRSGDELSSQQRVLYILLIGAAMGLVPFSIDPLIPSFPHIAEFYKVSNSVVQYTITGLTAGLALGHVVAGPLSDALGRRKPMLISVALFFIAEFGCFLAPNIESFLALRVLLGIGASGATVIGFAIIRDLYVGQSMIKFMGRVYLIQGLAPILGPLVGSQLLAFMDWKQIFLVFTIYGALVFTGLYFSLIETLHSNDRRAKGFDGMAGRFRAVLRDRIYVGLLIFSVLQMVGLFTYLNTFSFLFQDSFGLSASTFGLWFAFNSAMSWVGVQAGAWLSKHIAPHYVVIGAACLALLAAAGLVLAGITGLPFGFVEACFALFMFSFASTITPLNSVALAQHGEEAGTAAALLGALNFAMPALATVLYNLLDTTTSTDAGIMMFTCYALGLVSIFVISRPRSMPVLEKG